MGAVVGTIMTISGVGIIMYGSFDFRLIGWVIVVVGLFISIRAQQRKGGTSL